MASYRFEHVLLEVGAGWKWHMFFFLLSALPNFLSAFHNFSTLILFYTPEHWCRVPYLDGVNPLGANWTLDRVREYAIPRMTMTPGSSYSRCEMYVRNYTAALSVPWSADISHANLTRIKCSAWTYDQSQMTSSVITDWNLVCDSISYASIGKSAYTFGMFFGSVTFGYLSDRFGRRSVFFVAALQYTTCAFLSIFAPTYWMYVVLRAFTGMAAIGAFLCIFVILNETVLPKFRGMMSIGGQTIAAIGIMMSAGLIYVSSADWKIFYSVCSVGLLSFFSFYWILPESPRWLILQDRLEDAAKTVRKIAALSRSTDLSDERLASMIRKCHQATGPSNDADDEEEELAGRAKWKLVLDVLVSPALRMNTLICCCLWASVNFGYYGILFASPQFATSLILVVFVGGVCEAPTGFLGAFLIRVMSRRAVLSGTFAFAGLCSLAFFYVPSEYRWLQTTVGMLGKLTVSLAFCVVYVLTAELFPTDHRSVAVGVCSAFGRIGSVTAPFVVDLFGSERVGDAMAVFGVELLVASGISLLAKETSDKSLPETEADVTNFDDLEFIDKEPNESQKILT